MALSLNTFDSNTLTGEGSRPLTKNSGKHRSLYLAIDETRSDALSPSDLAQSPKKLKCHSAGLPALILGPLICMAYERKRLLHVPNLCGNNLNSSRDLDFDPTRLRWRCLVQRERGVLMDITLAAILEMTRDDFDQVLTDFQLDMQSIGGALEERFSWTSAPLQRYDEWLANDSQPTQSHWSRLSDGFPDRGRGRILEYGTLYVDTPPSISSTLVLPPAQPCDASLRRLERVCLATCIFRSSGNPSDSGSDYVLCYSTCIPHHELFPYPDCHGFLGKKRFQNGPGRLICR